MTLFVCLWMSCSCITLLICDECISDYFMSVCVSIGRSVIFACVGVVFYSQACNVLINVLINCPNILTVIILTVFINESMDNQLYEMN